MKTEERIKEEVWEILMPYVGFIMNESIIDEITDKIAAIDLEDESEI